MLKNDNLIEPTNNRNKLHHRIGQVMKLRNEKVYHAAAIDAKIPRIDTAALRKQCPAANYLLPWLRRHYTDLLDTTLSGNTNPMAMEILRRRPSAIYPYNLSANSTAAAMWVLRQYPQKINWDGLSTNPHWMAIEMLQKQPDKISWTWLSRNPHPWAVEQLRANPAKIRWHMLCQENTNPDAIALVVEHSRVDNHNLFRLCANHCPAAIAIIRNNIARIAGPHWDHLSQNSSDAAVNLLREHPQQIVWASFCQNSNPMAAEMILAHYGTLTTTSLLRQAPGVAFNSSSTIVDQWIHHPTTIAFYDGDMYSSMTLACNCNPKLLPLIEKYCGAWPSDRIEYWHCSWRRLAENPHIFVDAVADQARIHFRNHVAAELIATVWHPRNIAHFRDLGYDFDA